MFDQLSDRLGAIFSRLSGRGKIGESELDVALREVRVALLEADVALAAARDFVSRVKERALGADVLASLTPHQTILRIVHDELVSLLGPADPAQSRLRFSDAPPSVILLVGLQGSGKTTQAAKLALRLKEQGRRSLLVAADVYRPAAAEQLATLGKQIGIDVFVADGDPVEIASRAVEQAARLGLSTVIVDSAGRLQIDDEMMDELVRMKRAVSPAEVLLVADAMTGQEAAGIATAFAQRVGITGVVLTKLDGDARGGAALSIFQATGAPIKFAGVGERVSALEPFYPDRMASRILGMGDVMTLIEKTQGLYSAEQAKKLEARLARNAFTLDDFLEQIRRVRSIGSMGELLKMIPGVSRSLPKDFTVPENEVRKVEAIICSMTRRERRDPGVLDGSRRKRIALGSGTQVSDVNRLVRQFGDARRMLKQFGGKRGMRLPTAFPGK
ncbi:MAG: signal recognition particle protein [Candidatus Tyrphobacter sp.]